MTFPAPGPPPFGAVPRAPLREAWASTLRAARATLAIPLPALVGSALLVLLAAGALLAPIIAPQDPSAQFTEYPYAPPMIPHIFDDGWRPHAPFVYSVRLVNRLERRYMQDRSRRIPLLVEPEPGSPKPMFLLGTDALGRDVLSRLLYGARASLGIALAATVGAVALGMFVGALAGFAGGAADEFAMRVADLVLVLPAMYVVLALRATMPLVLSPLSVFAGLATVLALVGWPVVARAVRAIVARERTRDYAEAARASGASSARVLFVHLLPAARGTIVMQAALLIPGFVLAEATLSFVGFGFAEPIASWGTMLQEAGSVRVFGEYPWLLAPGLAIAVLNFAVSITLTTTYRTRITVQY